MSLEMRWDEKLLKILLSTPDKHDHTMTTTMALNELSLTGDNGKKIVYRIFRRLDEYKVMLNRYFDIEWTRGTCGQYEEEAKIMIIRKK